MRGLSLLFSYVLVIGAASLTGCFQSVSTVCPSGLVCPESSRCTASGTHCMAQDSTCGDGQLDEGEDCDDGNLADDDACLSNCRPKGVCGDGVIDTLPDGGLLELCDDGNRDGGDGCSADCTRREQCGNGTLDPEEECDEGAELDGGLCRASCRLKRCGDGIADVFPDGGMEECDDGAANGTTSCSLGCHLANCGNGVVDIFDQGQREECDDGNRDAGDGCGPNCTVERCGNEIVEPPEVCDRGPLVSGDGCRADCRGIEVCGDGLWDPLLPDGGREECDDGNRNAFDGCTNDCRLARCGDSLIQAGVEACDTGGESTLCNRNCTTRRCGDGLVNLSAGEQCDVVGLGDGGTATAECDSDCTLAFCGDGTLNAARGEACDTGGATSSCNANCTLPTCGDGVFNAAAGEACDTQGETAACDGDCTAVSCGDGRRNPLAGELCDDGNAINTDDCVTGCRPNVCGDGWRDQQGPSTEACDDGNAVTETACAYGVTTCAGCAADCQTSLTLHGPSCGDAFLNGPELCDDGNTATEATCPYGTPTCDVCNANCTAVVTRYGSYCGDGVINSDAGELCDDSNNTTETACPYGQALCSGCIADCSQVLSLTGGVCGDGQITPAFETCDDGNALACGSCNANCRTEQPPLAAQGSISTISEDVLSDGETLTLDDGSHAPTLFCFRKSPVSTCPGAAVLIDLTGSGSATADAVADLLVAAINSVNASLAVSATRRTSVPWVGLTHDVIGGSGNRPIQETVASPDFEVVGMRGGGGSDCPAGTGCTQPQDCASGVCTSGQCQ